MPECKEQNINILPQSTKEIKKALYIEKRTALEDHIVLAASLKLAPKNVMVKIWKQLKNMQEPQFPLKGKDLLKIKIIQEGPELGELIKKVERWWINRNFVDSKEKCIEQAKKILGNINKKS